MVRRLAQGAMTELVRPPRSPIVVQPQAAAPVAYTDVDFTIAAETAEQLLKSTPENTQRAYDRNWDQFSAWCLGEGRVPLPATPQTLADYVVRLIGIGLAPATIDQVIGTVRSKHTDAGHDGTPNTKASLKLLRAYKREWADQGNRVRKAPPLLLDGLRAMVDTCDLVTLAGVRDRALLLLGYNMMARRSEVVGLDHMDVREAEEGLVAFIRRSKTDQAAEGVEVNVPYGQHPETCAVRTMAAWWGVLAERDLTSGALFRPIDRHGRIGGEPGSAGRTSKRLTGKSASDIVHRRGVLAGLRDEYTFHSVRSGAATSAYAAGVPVSVIADHGRWSATSPVVLGYIRAVDKWKNNAMKGIGL
jgi:integrase